MSDRAIGLLVGGIVGFVFGVATVMSMAFYYAGKEMKKKKSRVMDFYKELDKVKDTLKKATDVQERMNKVKQITKEQLDLQMQVELPQKNALDGQYKNSLSRKITSMEEEKKGILQSILNDGFDPEITIMNSESKLETMKLSEFMTRNNMSAEPTIKTKSKSKAKLKLIEPLKEEPKEESKEEPKEEHNETPQ